MMKGLYKIHYFLLFISICIGEVRNWDYHSAYLIPEKRWEIGLFQPFRYGYSDSFEYSTYPLWFFVMPNVTFKKKHQNILNYKFASKLGLLYPTPILNMVAREGLGGFIDPTFRIPPMLGISLSLVMTNEFFDTDVTLNSGFDLGVKFGELDQRANIELPLLYHRLSIFHNGYGLHSGIDLKNNLTKNISIFVDCDLSILPGTGTNETNSRIAKILGEFALEHKLLLIYERSNRLRIMTGYKYIYGKYPFGNESRLLPFVPLLDSWVPIIELQWGGSKK